MVKLFLYEAFRMELPGGQNLTLTSVKAQALVAMLATAPNGTRSKAWIKSRLWSTRYASQATGSLRQCLLQLRNLLRDKAPIIHSDRLTISIDLSAIEIVDGKKADFLEGTPISDEKFLTWLNAKRTEYLENPAPSKKAQSVFSLPEKPQPVISVTIRKSEKAEIDWLLQSLSDILTQQLRETLSVEVITCTDDEAGPNLWNVDLAAARFEAEVLNLRMCLARSATGAQHWAKGARIKMVGALPLDHPEVLLLINQLVEAIADTIFSGNQAEGSPDGLCRRAIRTLFAMRPEAVSAADAMFAEAFSANPRGLYLAWRAQAKTIAMAERHNVDPQSMRDEAEALCAKALELEPNNSMVLATVANTYGQLFKNHGRSLVLAERGTLINPSNSMAWWALSSASVYVGDTKASLSHAIRASQLVVTSPNKFWWENQLFGSALMEGRLGNAKAIAERCHAHNPNFRPPLRYLIALYSSLGRNEDAIEALKKLQELEPDFSVDQLLSDRSYPASLIHKAPGLDLNPLSDLV